MLQYPKPTVVVSKSASCDRCGRVFVGTRTAVDPKVDGVANFVATSEVDIGDAIQRQAWKHGCPEEACSLEPKVPADDVRD